MVFSSCGFVITAVVIPIFSWIYCFIMYAISISLPVPRTTSVTHEMAIAPFFSISSLGTSSIYFILVFVFVMNRSMILDLVEIFLTPLIILILLCIISIGVFTMPETASASIFEPPFIDGIFQGYQTFDAIGSVVVGGVLIISLKLKGNRSFDVNRELIRKAGFVAGFGLLVIYGGLILNGALFSQVFEENATRTQVLSFLSSETLGNIGTTFLSV